jgi:PAS domain S-box-containing protein
VTEAIQELGASAEAAMELPIFRQNGLISRTPSWGHLAWLMMPSRIATFRGSAAQCFYGTTALAVVTFVCFRLEADLATTAFIYLAVIVLLAPIGSYFVSVGLTIIAVAGLDYFFAQPAFSFAIDTPQDVALVIVFSLTSLAVTGLVRRVRKPMPALAHPTAAFGTPVEQLEVGTAVKTSDALTSDVVTDRLIETLTRSSIEHALEVGTVVKASQALSSEIVIDRLIEIILQVAIEHAGAERGLLVFLEGDAQRIEAEATAGLDGIEVRICGTAVTSSELPVSLIQYVVQTLETVILDDASAHNQFSADHYFHQKRCRSILCLPLVLQSKLIGVLYLENSFGSHVFTPARASLLKMLASQAAICIENARLYADLLAAQQLVRKAEGDLRLAINTVPALVWTALPDGSLDFINQRWQEIGLSLDDLQGSEWINVLHPDERAGVVDRWRIAVDTGTAYENIERVRRVDGEYRWFLSRAQPLRDELGKIVKWFGVDTEIEDQKRAEDALRDSEQRFRDFTESASDWYWETGPDHRFIAHLVSEQLLDKIGVLPDSRIGMLRWDFARDLEEEPEKWRLHLADLDAHKPFRDFRYRAASRDGSEVYIAASGKPLFDSDGRFLGYRGVARQITAAVRAALLEEALQEAKVVGDNIAHDLRTPLTRVRLRLERGREHAATLEELRAVADQAIAGLDHSLTTITALLRITEIEHTRRREGFSDVQLASLLREAGDLYEPIAENKGVILRIDAPDGAVVDGDRDLLFEAVANLVDNAVKFTPEGGSVDLALLDQEGETVIRVSDTGPGISEAEREAVTQRFYRSDKSRNTKGLGLGLSMVAAIIKLHSFRLTISAGPGCTAEIVCPHAD